MRIRIKNTVIAVESARIIDDRFIVVHGFKNAPFCFDCNNKDDAWFFFYKLVDGSVADFTDYEYTQSLGYSEWAKQRLLIKEKN